MSIVTPRSARIGTADSPNGTVDLPATPQMIAAIKPGRRPAGEQEAT